jgi:K+-transporting ATPase ATPase A chain
MQTGEVIFGGVGAGLYGMLLFVILAVFIAGLMVGRTPEYLGKKIEAYDVKLVMIVLMALAATILGGTAWSAASGWGQAGLNNSGPHGFSELLYAYTSAAGNNGSAFAGLTATPANGDLHFNVTLGIAMLLGRFLMIVPILALAGNLAGKRAIPESAGTFRTEGITFVVLLIGTVVLVGALTFLPGLVLGPVIEHFLMCAGTLF